MALTNKQKAFRSIPTGVGKTTLSPASVSCSTVHPHGCGENPLPLRFAQDGGGPSPRVWGKLTESCLFRGRLRSIPTGVGKTGTATCHVRSWSVHPHGCGENRARTKPAEERLGPSPRVWGKPVRRTPCAGDCRSIPTGVGKTQRSAASTHSLSVHPHGCGENTVTYSIIDNATGPSPRVWGKRRGWQPAR